MAPPEKLKVFGREGFNAPRINGNYQLRKQKIGDRCSYIKMNNEENKMVIWYWKEKNVWMMTRLSMVNTESAYACVQENAADPTVVSKPWNVYDKTAGSHVPDKKLKMVPIEDENQKPDTPESLQEDLKKLVFSLEKMGLCLDDLADTINYQESQRDALQLELDQIVTAGENLEQEKLELEKKFKETKRKLYTVHLRFKKDSLENEKLKLQSKSSPPSHSFPQVFSFMSNNPDIDHMHILQEACRKVDLSLLLHCFARHPDLCQTILQRYREST